MTEPNTVRALLETGLAEANAIGAPGRPSLSYGGLREHVDRTVYALNAMGLGRGERVSIVLPNGPEMASAFVSIAAGATTAPLNPGYKRKEYDFYLGDLGAKALVVEEGSESEAIDSARSLGIGVVELRVPDGAPAGAFDLVAQDSPANSGSGAGKKPTRPTQVPHRPMTLRSCCIRRARRRDRSSSHCFIATCARRPRTSARR